MKAVLDKLINKDQTVFIKGRLIRENTRLIYMTLCILRNIITYRVLLCKLIFKRILILQNVSQDNLFIKFWTFLILTPLTKNGLRLFTVILKPA